MQTSGQICSHGLWEHPRRNKWPPSALKVWLVVDDPSNGHVDPLLKPGQPPATRPKGRYCRNEHRLPLCSPSVCSNQDRLTRQVFNAHFASRISHHPSSHKQPTSSTLPGPQPPASTPLSTRLSKIFKSSPCVSLPSFSPSSGPVRSPSHLSATRRAAFPCTRSPTRTTTNLRLPWLSPSCTASTTRRFPRALPKPSSAIVPNCQRSTYRTAPAPLRHFRVSTTSSI